MEFPLEIGYGEFKLSAHILLETLAFIIGFRYFLALRSKQVDKISDKNRIWILIGATLGALIFSRLLGAFENPKALFYAENKILYIYSTKTIVGGLLGGLLMVEFFKRLIGEKSSSGDLFTYPLILAMIIGRIGCFTSGIYEETYGEETTFFMGMDLGDGLQRHPVALYEIIFLVFVSIFLRSLEQRNPLKEGYRFQLFMLFYLIFRFILDFIKPGTTFFLEIGMIQIACIVGFFYYYKMILRLLLKPRSIYNYD